MFIEQDSCHGSCQRGQITQFLLIPNSMGFPLIRAQEMAYFASGSTMDASAFFKRTYRHLVERPNGRYWFHSVPLPNGDRIVGAHSDSNVQTKLWDTLAVNPNQKRVLDIGANDGFFTIAALLAGAKSATAINTADCPTYPENLSFAAKEWNVTPHIVIDDFQAHPFVDNYDVILFLGVLYHLENIFAAMRLLRRLLTRRGALYLETQMSQINSQLPLYEAASDIFPTIAHQRKDAVLCTGVSNFLFPNEAAVQNLAHTYDFACERLEGDYVRDYPSRGVFKLTKTD
jgi:2-polyprenyl-3-methyl-5-hydroxy-6-metoxy-1,4-benzoquinol methylase